MDFSLNPKGGSNDVAPNFVRLDFNELVYRARFVLPSFEIGIATAPNLGPQRVDFFEIAAGLYGERPVIRNKFVSFSFPLRVETSFQRFASEENVGSGTGAIDDLTLSNGTIGSGGQLAITPSLKYRFDIYARINYGFSLRSFGATTGERFAWNGGVTVSRRNLFGDVGLGFGYHYLFAQSNLDGTQDDYRTISHNFSIALLF